MIIFVIPLKSKKVSNSWQKINSLFEQTLRSVCNQTSQEFKVLVVCHEKPTTSFDHENVVYITVDFPPPVVTGKPFVDLCEKRFDHKMKLWVGSVHAEPFKPTHIMFVDADDYVSRHLANHVQKNKDSNGWYIDKGFEYPNGKNVIYSRKKLYQKCGSSNIIRYDLLKPLLNKQPCKDNFIETNNFLNHKLLHSYFENIGHPLEPLPFQGAIYVTGHGDNIFLEYFSQKNKNHLDLIRLHGGRIRKLLMARLITKKIRDEFSL